MNKIRIVNFHVEMVDSGDDALPYRQVPALFVNGNEVARGEFLPYNFDDEDIDIWVAQQFRKLLRAT